MTILGSGPIAARRLLQRPAGGRDHREGEAESGRRMLAAPCGLIVEDPEPGQDAITESGIGSLSRVPHCTIPDLASVSARFAAEPKPSSEIGGRAEAQPPLYFESDCSRLVITARR